LFLNFSIFRWTLKDPSVVISGEKIAGKGDSANYNIEKKSINGMSQLQLGPREREISTSPYLDLSITSQLHGQWLRCWASPVLPKTVESGVSIGSATWKHTSILLTVNYGPKLQGPEEEVETVAMGGTAQLTCQVEANPPAMVTWHHYRGFRIVNRATVDAYPNATGLYTPTVITHRLLRSFLHADLVPRDFKKQRSEERYSTLNVKTRSVDGFGIYICVGLAAQREVRKVTVLAESGPPIIETPQRVSGRIGDSGRIDCKVIALPRASPQDFLWSSSTHPSGVIPSSSRILKLFRSLHLEHEEGLIGSKSTLIFTKIAKENFGDYNCTVTTPFGSASSGLAHFVPPILFAEEMPYILAITVGVATVLAAIFFTLLCWIIRRHIIHKRGCKTARIITANPKSGSSVDLHCDRMSTLGRHNAREEFIEDTSNVQPATTCTSQFYPMQSHTSLLRSPVHVVSCEEGALYKYATSTNPNTPLLSRLHDTSTSQSSALYVATTTEVLAASPVHNIGLSRIALLANRSDATDGFQDHAFPT
uniref:Ig-like domain-containing protein n=1 Tax=Rodentolepis nana TaxID=102285 RepID=A0A0R3TP03_RODNA